VDRELLSGASDRETLEAQIETLERVVSATADGILSLDWDGRVRFAGEGVEPMLGYGTDNLIEEPVESMLASELVVDTLFDVQSPVEFREHVLDGNEVTGLEVPLEASDGTVVPVSVSTVVLEQCVVCLLQRRAHLDYDRAFAREATGNAGDPMYALDATGTIRWVNDAMCRYAGYERDELLDRSIRELVPDEEYEKGTEVLLDIASGGAQARTIESQFVTSSGESILTEVSLTPLTDDNGAYAGSVGVLRDITERRERERELELLKKVLTRVFRHNVRNELTVIQGHAELVRLADDEELTDHGDAIVESAQRLFDHSEKARLIEQVLETDSRDEKNIAREARAAVTSLSWEHSDADIEVDLPEEVSAEAHPQIRNAIEELVENAIIHVPPAESPEITVWLDEGDRTVTLYVEDNAGGLADHELQVLQEGRETDLEHGSGVGLWLVRWLVEASGAELIAYQVDDGTLMGIRFQRPGAGS
jgi:PAS domain S-box-containing protein